ncbi:hypothetical protein GX51_05461 [Blastomyces parvus]|uniref:Uncharacterized protein n=1 Tax=Blastomyces parvus TaxID=2060905 RepID=A0A2B7WWG4_9EURO|nr:hypothetical protein GX51_05461 [Blastomyces parvus]
MADADASPTNNKTRDATPTLADAGADWSTPAPPIRFPLRPPPPLPHFLKYPFYARVFYDTTRFAGHASAAKFIKSRYSNCWSVASVPATALSPHSSVRLRPSSHEGAEMVEIVPAAHLGAVFTAVRVVVAPYSAGARLVAARPARMALLWRLSSDLIVLRKDLRMNGSSNGDVAIYYTRGEVSQTSCENCKRGNGPFESCVVPTEISEALYTSGACCNCLWNSKGSSCNLSRDELMTTDSDDTTSSPSTTTPPSPQLRQRFSPRPQRRHLSLPSGPDAASAAPGPAPAKRPRLLLDASPSDEPLVRTLDARVPSAHVFSPGTRVHQYVGIPLSLPSCDLGAVRQALDEATVCVNLLQNRLNALKKLDSSGL